MKLLQKTSRIYLVISASILLLGGSLIFFLMTAVVEEEVLEKLSSNKMRISQQIKDGNEIAQLPPVIEVETLYFPIKDTTIVTDLLLNDLSAKFQRVWQHAANYLRFFGF